MSSTTIGAASGRPECTFEVRVQKETFKFNAAHFVAFQGFRERLHGHNYQVGVKLIGTRKICSDGYVIDYGCVKAVTKKICKDLNEHFLCPMLSNVLTIDIIQVHNPITQKQDDYVTLHCNEDGSDFRFPKGDCALLPIVHATTEELAIYLYGKILNDLDPEYLRKRGIHTMEVTVSEAPGQEATFRMELPAVGSNHEEVFDVASYVTAGDIIPMPCPTTTERAN
mmetsp:Transcript_27940/g.39282  ORF Transcript_27940/g.39282 Transcript_27940/m.39282 type:complete len:225 (+) Transcript_27940:137-811(+)